MIYIYDDRAQRRKDNQEKLSGYCNLVSFSTINYNPGVSADEAIIDSIDNPDCIIFHKSYVFDDANTTFETIRELFSSLDVPIVIFSGGIEGSNKGVREININADLMYANLPYFLEDFRKNGVINIDTLLWGKRYKLNSILQFQNALSEQFIINNNPDDIIENIDEVTRTIHNRCRKINKEFGDNLLAEISTREQLTWLELADIIDNQIEKQY